MVNGPTRSAAGWGWPSRRAVEIATVCVVKLLGDGLLAQAKLISLRNLIQGDPLLLMRTMVEAKKVFAEEVQMQPSADISDKDEDERVSGMILDAIA
jgi:hypothetical protein